MDFYKIMEEHVSHTGIQQQMTMDVDQTHTNSVPNKHKFYNVRTT